MTLLSASDVMVFAVRLSLAATVVWVLAAGVSLMLHRASASLRHRVWLMGVVATLFLPVLVALAPQWQVAHVWVPAKSAVSMAPSAVTEIPALKHMSEAAVQTNGVAGGERFPSYARASANESHAPDWMPDRSSPGISRSPDQPTISGRNVSWPVWLAGLWMVIASWLMVRQLVSMMIAAAVVRRAVAVKDGPAPTELDRLVAKLNFRASPRLRQSAEIQSPICVGVFFPSLILPAGHASWAAEQLRAILTHELAHVVRRDVLWQTLARLQCAVYWFHPLAWGAAWRMRVERELACDDWVLRGGESSTRYARWLVEMAALLGRRSQAVERAGVAMASRNGFQSRLSAILDSRRSRSLLSRRATLFIAIIAGVLVIPLAVLNPLAPRRATAANPPPASQPAIQPAENMRTAQVRFVDAVTGQPVAGVNCEFYWPEPQRSGKTKFGNVESDTQGQCALSFPSTEPAIGFFYRKAKYVQSTARMGGQSGNPLSDLLTVRLQPGVVIGGVIQDEQGNGVPGAKVQLSFSMESPESSTGQTGANGVAETDSQGKWTFDGAPSRVEDVSVYPKHPDFIMSSFYHRYNAGEYTGLLDKSLVTVIRRGITVTGEVVDELGKPVAGATVAPDSFGIIAEVLTDSHGHYELRGVEPGARSLAARAEGHAPQMVDAAVAAGIAPIIFHLEKGHTLLGRVVDSHGNGVPGATVSVGKWRKLQTLAAWLTTDADGRFVWNDAPADEVGLSALNGDGFIRMQPVTAVAGGKEVELVLAAADVCRGNVVDDQTGKPIERFVVHVDSSVDRQGASTSFDRSGFRGTYECICQNFPQAIPDSYKIRITAEGYLPAESGILKRTGNEFRFDARLKAGGGMTGTVLTPDGKPAKDADVVLTEVNSPTVVDGELTSWAKSASPSAITDAAGHFKLPPRTGDIKLMVIHDSGWNFVKIPAGESLQSVPLRAWCRLEGTLMKGSKPWPGQTITVWPQPASSRDDVARWYFQYSTTTDAEGKFKVERLADGGWDVGRRFIVPDARGNLQSYEVSQKVPVKLESGEQKSGFQIGGTGRPVVSRVVVSDDLKVKGLIPVTGSLRLVRPESVHTPSYQNHVKELEALLSPDGSLRFEDVPVGDYMLDVSVLRASPEKPNFWEQQATGQTRVVVPEMPGGRSDDPLDAGPVHLTSVLRPKVGEKAPEFSPPDFSNGQIKLSDYQGKFVLLDFWATWCGPCIAEIPHMEKLNQKYANDPRLVVVGVSVDDTADRPAKFLSGRKLPWLQAFGGSSAWTTFGIGAIPSVWLIGPDGKIIAKEIPSDDLGRVVAQGLSKAE